MKEVRKNSEASKKKNPIERWNRLSLKKLIPGVPSPEDFLAGFLNVFVLNVFLAIKIYEKTKIINSGYILKKFDWYEFNDLIQPLLVLDLSF